jgi:hypothetical protein
MPVAVAVVEAACGAIANLCGEDPGTLPAEEQTTGMTGLEGTATTNSNGAVSETNAGKLGRLGACEALALALKAAVSQLPQPQLQSKGTNNNAPANGTVTGSCMMAGTLITTTSSGQHSRVAALEQLLQLLCSAVYFLAASDPANQARFLGSSLSVRFLLQGVEAHPLVVRSKEYAAQALSVLQGAAVDG